MVYDINRPKDIAASILVNLSLESFTLKETNDGIVRTPRGITHGQELRPTAVGASPLGSCGSKPSGKQSSCSSHQILAVLVIILAADSGETLS